MIETDFEIYVTFLRMLFIHVRIHDKFKAHLYSSNVHEISFYLELDIQIVRRPCYVYARPHSFHCFIPRTSRSRDRFRHL